MMPGEAPFDQSLDHIPKRPTPQQHSVFRAGKSFRQWIAADPLGSRLGMASNKARVRSKPAATRPLWTWLISVAQLTVRAHN
jgi:hypothetical protein